MVDIPLLGHHEDPLHQEALEDLRPDALEQAHQALVLDDELHHLDEARKGLAVPCRRRLGLQADLGHNQGLGGYCCEGL